MPRTLKCDWDRCKHWKDGMCDNPEEVNLTTKEARVGSVEKYELLYCNTFVDFEEGDG